MGRVSAKSVAMKVPRQCPIVLIKMGWREGKTFCCEEQMKGEAVREVEHGSTALS
jgi:hypothetical protein